MNLTLREKAKKYFDEELSGEPLSEDVVIDALCNFSEDIFEETKKFCYKIDDKCKNGDIN